MLTTAEAQEYYKRISIHLELGIPEPLLMIDRGDELIVNTIVDTARIMHKERKLYTEKMSALIDAQIKGVAEQTVLLTAICISLQQIAKDKQ